jgi:hypothetical protein
VLERRFSCLLRGCLLVLPRIPVKSSIAIKELVCFACSMMALLMLWLTHFWNRFSRPDNRFWIWRQRRLVDLVPWDALV